jgi:hypothetical protein
LAWCSATPDPWSWSVSPGRLILIKRSRSRMRTLRCVSVAASDYFFCWLCFFCWLVVRAGPSGPEALSTPPFFLLLFFIYTPFQLMILIVFSLFVKALKWLISLFKLIKSLFMLILYWFPFVDLFFNLFLSDFSIKWFCA